MLPIKSFFSEEKLEELASRSNFRYGKQIAEDWEIVITDQNTFNIHADLKHKNKFFQTDLMSTTKGLRWKCSCTNKKNHFCEHCVAVGLKVVGLTV